MSLDIEEQVERLKQFYLERYGSDRFDPKHPKGIGAGDIELDHWSNAIANIAQADAAVKQARSASSLVKWTMVLAVVTAVLAVSTVVPLL